TPRTFLTANVIAAPTAEEADERALPQQRMMARLRTNKPLTPHETVEQAQAGAAEFDGLAASVMQSARAGWFVGDPATVATDLRAVAERWGVDEVMISPVAGSYDAEPMDASPGRLQTLELLASAG
ncbi:MAG: LLM class flavin-dependent oxidoreductase, partial [Microbacterium sp.]